jgi:hypothetical protein
LGYNWLTISIESKKARKQESKEARKQGSKEARKQGSKKILSSKISVYLNIG